MTKTIVTRGSAALLVVTLSACSDPAARGSNSDASSTPSSATPAAAGDAGAANSAHGTSARSGTPAATASGSDAQVVSSNSKPTGASTTGTKASGSASAGQDAAGSKPAVPRVPVVDGYTIVNTFTHDASSFTQGLVYDGGRLLESQGQYGESSLRLVELESGKVLKKLPLEARYFAEGCAVLGGLVYQLTWREGVVFVYDARELRSVGSFQLAGEGWGLTTDGTQLILSDGSDTLRFVDPKSQQVVRRVAVRFAGRPLLQLNELEWVEGEVWANVWHSEFIARIDPKTGEVLGTIDLRGLLPAAERRDPESVLNGIAYDAAKKRIFVTGKRWPKLFEIRVQKRT